jgi:hypothetical protein
MPRLSLYRPTKQNDYRYIDSVVSQQLTIGGTDLYVHKYLGPTDQGASTDATQPQYDALNPNNIQDLLFLENRDRTYDPNIYRLRGHYNVANLDFDLSQFGLFLNNDIIFISVHYNDMIDILGRKLMVGDVIELPHMLDYNPLDETIPVALKRFYQVTDASYASEGFSVTWYPHLWRIKCEPLVDSQEFSQILQAPVNQDTYLGIWDATRTYPAGYVITYGDKNYTSIQEVPVGVAPPDPTYWQLDTADNLKDILGTYNKNIQINDAQLTEAARLVPKAGYDNSNLYVVPTYGEYESNGVLSGSKQNQPAPPYDTVINSSGGPIYIPVTVSMMRDSNYKNPSPAIRISKEALELIWGSVNVPSAEILDKFIQASLQAITLEPERIGSGSGAVSGETILTVQSLGPVTGPYGTSDNTYATSDQDPDASGFTGTVSTSMNYRADCDPRYQFITRSSPRSFGYTTGYLTGTADAPNGYPTGAGISFPQNPEVGTYFLRIDYFPQILYRWDGTMWVRISTNVRTETGFGVNTANNSSQLNSFINNSNVTVLTNGTTTTESQPLSTILKADAD